MVDEGSIVHMLDKRSSGVESGGEAVELPAFPSLPALPPPCDPSPASDGTVCEIGRHNLATVSPDSDDGCGRPAKVLVGAY